MLNQEEAGMLGRIDERTQNMSQTVERIALRLDNHSNRLRTAEGKLSWLFGGLALLGVALGVVLRLVV